MVRTKEWDRGSFTAFFTDSEGSEGDDPGPSPAMPRTAVLSEKFTVKEVSDRQVLFTPDGCWADYKYYFVKKAPDVSETRYYRDLSSLYRNKHPDGDPGPYDKE